MHLMNVRPEMWLRAQDVAEALQRPCSCVVVCHQLVAREHNACVQSGACLCVVQYNSPCSCSRACWPALDLWWTVWGPVTSACVPVILSVNPPRHVQDIVLRLLAARKRSFSTMRPSKQQSSGNLVSLRCRVWETALWSAHRWPASMYGVQPCFSSAFPHV